MNFVDFGPTLLSLCGVAVPGTMQGKPFLGPRQAPARYVYGFRDRMDERYRPDPQCPRQPFNYIRNYRPDRPYFHDQHVSYMPNADDEGLAAACGRGKLSGPAAMFMAKTKPVESLRRRG